MSRTAELQGKVDNVKSQMQKNLDSAMQRGDHLEDMEERAGNLANTADLFQKKTRRLRKKERCSNIKLWLVICVPFICIVLIVLIVIAIVVAVIVSNQNNN